MKSETEKTEKSTVQELREIRDKIGTEIEDMNYEQLKKYIEDKLTLHPIAVWQKED
jgi:hypothetical protein